jgi:hypothetical protein
MGKSFWQVLDQTFGMNITELFFYDPVSKGLEHIALAFPTVFLSAKTLTLAIYHA